MRLVWGMFDKILGFSDFPDCKNIHASLENHADHGESNARNANNAVSENGYRPALTCFMGVTSITKVTSLPGIDC